MHIVKIFKPAINYAKPFDNILIINQICRICQMFFPWSNFRCLLCELEHSIEYSKTVTKCLVIQVDIFLIYDIQENSKNWRTHELFSYGNRIYVLSFIDLLLQQKCLIISYTFVWYDYFDISWRHYYYHCLYFDVWKKSNEKNAFLEA